MKVIKILLVDHDEDDYILMRDLLSSGVDANNYWLSWCTTYSDAINAMLKDHYDLYLVDYKIGKHYGLHLLNEAVKSNCTKPIIILTKEDDQTIDEEALNAGAANYLTKDKITGTTLKRSIHYATKQFTTLEQLKRNKHTFHILFERLKDAILISDLSGQILDANKSALQLFGLEYANISDVNCAFFYRSPEERQALIKILQRDGVINDMLIEVLTLSGEVKTCCINSFMEIPQHGDSELLYTVVKEVTKPSHQFFQTGLPLQPHNLRTQLLQSVRAVRTSLSKITQEIEHRFALETPSQDAALLDTIRMTASFADQALQTLEEEHERYQR